MTPKVLKPSLELLRQEYVLVQAWKKTSNYIRYHNWYADTLELDRTTVNLPEFIASIADSLESPEHWESDPIRLVLAPKSQQWRVHSDPKAWTPINTGSDKAPLRPLAHVSLRDQVVATALMLCLANRVETKQGDTTRPIQDLKSRRAVASYGNRLFCDSIGDELHHRWGSAKLYRAYFQDYRTFISRPAIVATSLNHEGSNCVFVVESDLRQFYDRVRPARLMKAIWSLQRKGDDPAFFNFAERFLDWRWHSRDASDAAAYGKEMGVNDFTQIALPQGLVSAGFLANVVLLDFDESLRSKVGQEIARGIYVEDACRYVDDLRIVVTTDHHTHPKLVQTAVSDWLQELLTVTAPGLQVSADKTKAAEYGGSEQPLIRQSIKMERIQSAVSGGFDAVGGAEILDAIQGLMRSQEALRRDPTEGGWQFSPLPDVRDETVARFSAARFRTTYRSLRPLLEDAPTPSMAEDIDEGLGNSASARLARTQQDLDEDARAFALGLIERWVEDPSNVRLLRIGLDIWPEAAVLDAILRLLRPFTERGGKRKGPRRVAWYCLAELLRAGATETGLAENDECLPHSVDLQHYRELLREEAARLIQLPSATIPWYVRQQALLFHAVFRPDAAPVVRTGRIAETQDYRKFILFLRGEHARLKSTDFATFAVLMRRGLSDAPKSINTVLPCLTPARKIEIAVRDPSFAHELYNADNTYFDGLPARIREDLCSTLNIDSGDMQSLSNIIMNNGPDISLRNELSILGFASALLQELHGQHGVDTITPRQVILSFEVNRDIADITCLVIRTSRIASGGSLYHPPSWCTASERWRFQLGFLVRFILARQPDFTGHMRPEYWKERSAAYRPVRSHWFQRIYGFFNGQQAFGDDWLPISDWLEQFLSALLRWPGCHTPDGFEWVDHGVDTAVAEIEKRISCLNGKRGTATGTLLLPMVANRRNMDTATLRACVVQTIIPGSDDIGPTDITLDQPIIRKKHRNHLAAALAAVDRMLDLRNTHMQDDGRLDWLILPELAVHPSDIKTHLLPFARAHKTLILAGITYEELLNSKPPINSALWIMPDWSKGHGWQIRTRRQGKLHLAQDEEKLNVQGFRPCQWLIEFPWN